MEDTFFAEDWPAGFARRFAAAKGKGGGRGRHRRIEDLERLGALREFRGGGPFFGPPRGRGRARRRRGDVRMALLMLLAEEPRNGYQLMQVIEDRSEGRWRPSPGSVYPVLSQLEDEGLVRATEREGSKLFELTEAGHEHVANADTTTPPWETEDEGSDVEAVKQIRRLIPEVAQAAMQVTIAGSEAQSAQAVETLKNARRSLYRILAEEEDV